MERRLVDGEKVVLGKDGTSTSDRKLSDSIPMEEGSISDLDRVRWAIRARQIPCEIPCE